MSTAYQLRFEAEVLETIRKNPYSTDTQIRDIINWHPVDRVLLDRTLKKLVREGRATKLPGNFMRAPRQVFLVTEAGEFPTP